MHVKTIVGKPTMSKPIPKRHIRTKSKCKSVIRPRALSPVPEDMQVESTTGFSKVKESIPITNHAINDRQHTDFEMIIESDLPILTEDAEELTTVRSGAIDSQETRETTAESMLVDHETDELTIKPSVKAGLSTPSLVLIPCRWWEGLRPTGTPRAVPEKVQPSRRGRG